MHGNEVPDADDALAAAKTLAHKAAKTGACFFSPAGVDSAWTKKRPRIVISVGGKGGR